MFKSYITYFYIPNRILLGTHYFQQMFLLNRFYHGIVHVRSLGRPIIQFMVTVQEPLSRSIQFFKNIFYHSVLDMHW